MSKENIDRFEQRLRIDRQLAEQLWRLHDRERFLDEYVSLATSHGFVLSKDEAKRAGVLKKYKHLFQNKSDASKVERTYRTEGGLSGDVDGLSRSRRKGRVDF